MIWQQTLHWTPTSYLAEVNYPTYQEGPSQYNYELGLAYQGLSFKISGSIPKNKYEAQNSPSETRFGGFVEHHWLNETGKSCLGNGQWLANSKIRWTFYIYK